MQAAGMNVPITITSVAFVETAYTNVAIAALLDFSKSLRDQPVAFADMKAGFSNFFGSLKPNDVAEVIRFATENEVTQPFTTDVAALRTAIELPFNKGDDTRLYDTVFLGIDNVANSRTTYPGYRGVVIVATDGDQRASFHRTVCPYAAAGHRQCQKQECTDLHDRHRRVNQFIGPE